MVDQERGGDNFNNRKLKSKKLVVKDQSRRYQKLRMWINDRAESGPSYLAKVYVAVGRLAMAIHPQGQNQGQGQHTKRQQGVHQYIEQGRHSGWRPDFHCQGGTE